MSDCEKAAALLLQLHSGSHTGRAAKGAALAFRSRTSQKQRFIDVCRWMIGPQAYSRAFQAKVEYPLNANKTTAKMPKMTQVKFEDRSWNNKSYFFPIFRDEMNKNSELIQNPGYE